MDKPKNAWMTATVIVRRARRGCHLKGMVMIPLKCNNPNVAVVIIQKNVKIPPYKISGWPRNMVKAMVCIINYWTITLPVMEG